VKFVLDNDDQPLLSSSPRAVPSSQVLNEDYDSKEDDAGEEWLLYLPDAAEEATFLGALSTFTGSENSRSRKLYVEQLLLPVLVPTQALDEDDDVPSICESSLSSSSSDSSTYSRRVHFSEHLVTEVRFRPRTKAEERARLHYSFDDIQRFRQEYRMERGHHRNNSSGRRGKLLSDEDMSAIFGDLQSSSRKKVNRYDISRVVVLHNNVLETYMDHSMLTCNTKTLSKTQERDFFFDNESFWSGSITFY